MAPMLPPGCLVAEGPWTDPAGEVSAVSVTLARPLLEKEGSCWPMAQVSTESGEGPIPTPVDTSGSSKQLVANKLLTRE